MNNNYKNTNSISLANAENMIQAYKIEHGNDPDFLASEYFELASLQSIIKHPRCKGIRIYNGLKDNGETIQNRLIVAGIDENGKILITSGINYSNASAAAIGFGFLVSENVAGIAEHGQPCPPICN